jgi:hypothetical protein
VQFGRSLAGRLRDLGCVDVAADGNVSLWNGASPGARLLAANVVQLRDDMLKHGLVNACDLESDLARLRDPSSSFLSPMLWSVRGRRPPS